MASAVALGTKERLLDAAFASVADFGLSRLRMDDVAERAGVARQTVYRYFPSKDELLLALVLREEERFLDGVRAAFAAADSLRAALEGAAAHVLRSAREHPLLDRLLRTDADLLLPHLTTRGGPVIERARVVLEDLLRRRGARRALVARAADASVRLLVSYALNPPDDPPEKVARALADVLSAALDPSGRELR